MRILLTGAGGFIGSHVARVLTAEGDQVTAVLKPGEDVGRLKGVEGDMELVEVDLGSANLDRMVDEAAPDSCMHLAWHVEPSRYLTAVHENLAALATGARLLSVLDRAGIARALVAGTCLEPGTLIDGEPCRAETIYAAAKAALHGVGEHLSTTSVACAHIFYLFGPGESGQRIVPTVIRSCLEGRTIDVSPGEQRRDFLYVGDVASALVAVIKSGIRGKVDVCSGTCMPLRDVFDLVGQTTGRADLIRIGRRPLGDGEPLEISGDASTLASAGWEKQWTVEQGVVDTVEWWRRRLAAAQGDEARGST